VLSDLADPQIYTELTWTKDERFEDELEQYRI